MKNQTLLKLITEKAKDVKIDGKYYVILVLGLGLLTVIDKAIKKGYSLSGSTTINGQPVEFSFTPPSQQTVEQDDIVMVEETKASETTTETKPSKKT